MTECFDVVCKNDVKIDAQFSQKEKKTFQAGVRKKNYFNSLFTLLFGDGPHFGVLFLLKCKLKKIQ